jgi:Ser/Thr protein kinase RdoA (MazF antagonist)
MDETILAAAAAAFGAEASACRPVRGGNFSSVYSFTHADGPSILRLTPPNPEIDASWMHATLAFMDFLARGGVSVPAPRFSLGGELVVTLPGREGEFLAACFELAPGVLGEELPFDAWTATSFETLGRAVGTFHARARSYQPPPGMERPHWDQAGNCFNPSEHIPDPLLAQRRAEAFAAAQTLPRDPQAYGLIHADLHGGNFILEAGSGRITLLDFDDCARGWYAMDIAMCLHDFCIISPQPDKNAFGAHFLLHFLRGYLPAHPMDTVWIERLPVFLKLLETGIYAQVAEYADRAEPDSWVGRFMKGRSERIALAKPFIELDFSRLAVQALTVGRQ